ncbi:peroxiredoxin-like family protein [Marinicella sp. W31]|uniref:peroxiredoxin-like family protein n=1 Tax=Marinicella sp. W31 TaxID=3023713 RepID=UPI0037564C3C
MSLQQHIQDYLQSFRKKVDIDIQSVMAQVTQDLINSGMANKALQKGNYLPAFSLPNQLENTVVSNEVLSQGPMVLTFYRGGWCPYCNLELRAYQQLLPKIQACGAQLVAISPERPDHALSTAEKNDLKFEVLSDLNAAYARSLGLVFTLPEVLRPIYESFGIHVEKHNGSGQFDLPLPATYVIDKTGRVISAFVDADYTKRQNPQEVLKALEKIPVAA